MNAIIMNVIIIIMNVIFVMVLMMTIKMYIMFCRLQCLHLCLRPDWGWQELFHDGEGKHVARYDDM